MDALPRSRAAVDEVVWRRAVDVVWRYTGDGLVLLAVGGGDPVLLDAAGATVWEELAEATTVSQVALRVAERLGTTSSAVAPGVTDLVRVLSGHGLVVPTGG